MKMYVIMNGKRNGPHDPDAVKALYESGQVNGDDLAWKAGMDDWKPLKKLFPDWFDGSDELPAPPPPIQLSSPIEHPSSAAEKVPETTSIDNSPDSNDKKAQAVTSGKVAPSDTNTVASPPPPEEPVQPPPEKLYLGIAGEKRGPLSPDETTAILTSGEIDLDCLAWVSGMAGWKPLREVWPDSEKITPDSPPSEAPPPISLLDKLQSAFKQK